MDAREKAELKRQLAILQARLDGGDDDDDEDEDGEDYDEDETGESEDYDEDEDEDDDDEGFEKGVVEAVVDGEEFTRRMAAAMQDSVGRLESRLMRLEKALGDVADRTDAVVKAVAYMPELTAMVKALDSARDDIDRITPQPHERALTKAAIVEKPGSNGNGNGLADEATLARCREVFEKALDLKAAGNAIPMVDAIDLNHGTVSADAAREFLKAVEAASV